jgi:hypothetical protein
VGARKRRNGGDLNGFIRGEQCCVCSSGWMDRGSAGAHLACPKWAGIIWVFPPRPACSLQLHLHACTAQRCPALLFLGPPAAPASSFASRPALPLPAPLLIPPLSDAMPCMPTQAASQMRQNKPHLSIRLRLRLLLLSLSLSVPSLHMHTHTSFCFTLSLPSDHLMRCASALMRRCWDVLGWFHPTCTN